MLLLIVYALAGPCAWLLFACAIALADARMNRLRRMTRTELPQPLPSVTILIPAKDEGPGIRDCLERVMALSYPNADVVAIDDRSTDQTGAVMDEFSDRYPDRFRALHIAPGALPPGWLGKCNALYTAASVATGQWLLFVDSDVKVEPQALSNVLSIALGRRYDAVSIMTRLECRRFWEKLLLPLCAASVGVMALMSLTNDDNRKRTAFANGQFLLIRRDAYESVGGHAAVRDNITEDVALIRLMKSRGQVVRLFYGRHLASTRMHATLGQMFHGWARIFSGVCERRPMRIVLAIAFVLLSSLSAYAAVIYGIFRALGGDVSWLALGCAHLLLMTIVLAILYRMSGNAMRYALGFPLAAPVLLAIYAYAIRACRSGKIAWRGTHYTSGSAATAAPAPEDLPPAPPVPQRP